MAHSAFKAGVKRMLGLPEWQHRIGDQAAAAQEGVNLQVWRSTCLQEIARNNIGEITHEKCTRWYAHAQTYLPRCLAGEPIEG